MTEQRLNEISAAVDRDIEFAEGPSWYATARLARELVIAMRGIRSMLRGMRACDSKQHPCPVCVSVTKKMLGEL
jgi:hypothetical protein